VESVIGMSRWLDWEKSETWRSMLLIFVNASFFIYGLVYLSALADVLSATTEECLYTCFDVFVKVTFTAAMSSASRSEEMEGFYCYIKIYLDLMLGMRALVGSQFDIVITCKTSQHGLVLADTNTVLEKYTGRELAGKHLEDICVREVDRARLRQLKGPKGPEPVSHAKPSSASAVPWQRQEAMHQMAELIRVDLACAFAESGTVSAELFVAHSAGRDIDDDVLIGLRFGEESNNSFQENLPKQTPIHKPSGFSGESCLEEDETDSDDHITDFTDLKTKQC